MMIEEFGKVLKILVLDTFLAFFPILQILFDKSCGQNELGMSKGVFAGSLGRATLTSPSLNPRRTAPESKTQWP